MQVMIRVLEVSILLVLFGCSSLQNTKISSYENWKPSIKPKNVYQKFKFFIYLKSFNDRLFWVEGRPSEGGRYVIVMRKKDGTTIDLTPKKYSARSRVYEYGGLPYTVHGDDLYFVNFKDQRIYWQNLKKITEIRPITPKLNKDSSLGKYMDLTVSPNGKWLTFVYEKEVKDKENLNYIATINLERKKITRPKILAKGADFYKQPLYSHDGKKIAWLQWDHPYMPWYSTKLYLGEFLNGKIKSAKRINLEDKTTIKSFAFNNANTLFFSMDFPNQDNESFKNYYNIYKFQNNKIFPVTKTLSELSEIKFINNSIISVENKKGEITLKSIDSITGKLSTINSFCMKASGF